MTTPSPADLVQLAVSKRKVLRAHIDVIEKMLKQDDEQLLSTSTNAVLIALCFSTTKTMLLELQMKGVLDAKQVKDLTEIDAALKTAQSRSHLN